MSGLGKYFNSETYFGRANVAKATYASFALLYIVYRIRRASKSSPAEMPQEEGQGVESPSNESNGCPCDACKQFCQQNCPPTQPDEPASAVPSDPKLSIKEDPLFKQQQKRCECDMGDSNGENNDDDDYDCE